MASRGKGSRGKGYSFERRIAKDLTKWVGCLFSRCPMSGGWNKSGDITPKDPEQMTKWKFSLECKNQECFSVSSLFKIRSEKDMPKVIKKWWKQCTDDAKKHDHIPILVMTKNHEDVYCMMRRGTYERFISGDFKFPTYYSKGMVVVLWSDLMTLNYKKVLKNFTEVKGKK